MYMYVELLFSHMSLYLSRPLAHVVSSPDYSEEGGLGARLPQWCDYWVRGKMRSIKNNVYGRCTYILVACIVGLTLHGNRR